MIPRPSLPEIQSRVCERFAITADEIHSPRRLRRVSRPRQVAMHLARNTGRSWSQIGRFFDNRHHTTVMQAIDQVHRLRASDPAFDAKVSDLESWLSEHVNPLHCDEVGTNPQIGCDDQAEAGA